MKIITQGIFFILLIIAFTNCTSNPAQNETNNTNVNLRFDGVYSAHYTRNLATNYLRFYENGNVIEVISAGSPSQIKSWFNFDNRNVRKGTYRIEKNKIYFTTVFENESIEYSGTIRSNRLVLDSIGSDGKHHNKMIFRFNNW